ncbi:helix-turn-helix domain-containing protein [Mycobacterium intracellulare]|uniref:helix-turn-helix domain-containing protein n=1 Tax=Mycobacterium intracellulare TaxID=1767 RepID=UPI0034D19D0B
MSNSVTESRFLSTAEAAKYLGVSQNTLRRYIHKKIVPAHRLGPRLLKFDPSELDVVVKTMGR